MSFRNSILTLCYLMSSMIVPTNAEVMKYPLLSGTKWKLSHLTLENDTISVDSLLGTTFLTFSYSEFVLTIDTFSFIGKYEMESELVDSFGIWCLPRTIRRAVYSREILSLFGNQFFQIASHNQNTKENINQHQMDILLSFSEILRFERRGNRLFLYFQNSIVEGVKRWEKRGFIEFIEVE